METTMTPRGPTPRPRLAIAVGAGGVRSAAALGLAEVLAESGIRPDVVAGCGSGALVAAAIALDLYRDEAIRVMGRVWAPAVSRRTRWQSVLRTLSPLAGAVDDDFGLRDDAALVRELAVAFGGRRIEDVPLALRIVATDVATGRAVAIRRGSLAKALRVSAATPFLYPGGTIDGRRLCDGALSDPLALGAVDDATFVLSMGFSGTLPSRVDRPALLVGQAATTLVNNLMQARLEAVRASGRALMHIEPRFDRHVGRWDVGALAEMHEIGRETARARVGEIRRQIDRAQALATRPAGTAFFQRTSP